MWSLYVDLPEGHRTRVKEWAKKPMNEVLKTQVDFDQIKEGLIDRIPTTKLSVGLGWMDHKGTAVVAMARRLATTPIMIRY